MTNHELIEYIRDDLHEIEGIAASLGVVALRFEELRGTSGHYIPQTLNTVFHELLSVTELMRSQMLLLQDGDAKKGQIVDTYA